MRGLRSVLAVFAIPASVACALGAPIRRTDRPPPRSARDLEASRWRCGCTTGRHAPVDSPQLALRPQTIRLLTDDALGRIAGGFIMKDTIIIRTGGVAPAPTARDR